MLDELFNILGRILGYTWAYFAQLLSIFFIVYVIILHAGSGSEKDFMFIICVLLAIILARQSGIERGG